ncbi:unnamed protein product [Lymnaea stagnalis]|uniref:Monocarboxylate transporter n=1 Tax=Lymnaea stagnalis TaxID=6523 RepID=A0AAV2ICT0_LYMST
MSKTSSETTRDQPPASEVERPMLGRGNNPTGSRPKPKYGANVLVMDSAHSWVVCFANVFIYILNATFGRASHMTFLNFVEEFDVSITTASLGFTLTLVMFSISSMLVTSLIIPKTSERVACFLGNIIGFTCTICIGLAPNVAVYLIFMGIKGLGSAMVSVSAISMISQYFDKRRSFATAVAGCGLAVGSMGSPPVIKLLLENFGLRGTFLLIGGFEMNNLGMAMLLRPTSRYTTIIHDADKHSDDDDDDDDVKDDNTSNDAKASESPLINGHCDAMASARNVFETNEPAKNIGGREIVKSRAAMEMTSLSPKTSENNILKSCDGIITATSISEAEHGIVNTNGVLRGKGNGGKNSIETRQLNKNSEADKELLESRTTVKTSQSKEDTSSSNLSKVILSIPADASVELLVGSSPSGKLKSKSFSNDEPNANSVGPFLTTQGSVVTTTSYEKAARAVVERMNSVDASGSAKKSLYGSRTAKASISSTWSVVSASLNEMAVDVELSPQPQNHADGRDVARSKGAVTRALYWMHSAFSLELLRTWSLRILLMYSSAGVMLQYLATYLPTIARKEGLTPDEIARMLIVGGGVDFASRLAIGAFSDLKILRPTQIVVIAQFIIGTTCHFSRFFNSAPTLMGLTVILGLFGGTRQSLQTLVCLEFMGQDNFRRAYGFQLMAGTLTLSVHHPLLSSILEATGSFTYPLHYVGVAAYLSVVCLLLQPITKRLDEVKAKEQMPQPVMESASF